MSKKETFEDLEDYVKNSNNINVKPDDNTVEVISKNITSFFNMLFSGKYIKFTSIFEGDYVSSPDNLHVKINGEEIERKKEYKKDFLLSKMSSSTKADEVISSLLPIYQDDTLSRLVNKDNLYLSYGILYYQKKDSKEIQIAPLVYYHISLEKRKNDYYFVLDDNNPYYNLPLQSLLLSQYGIDISSLSLNNNPEEYLDYVKEVISKTLFAVDDNMKILMSNIKKDNLAAALIKEKDNIIFTDVFRALEENVSYDPKVPFTFKKNPHYVNEGLKLLSSSPLTKIDKASKLGSSFIFSMLDEYLLSEKSVLFVSPNKEKNKEVRQYLIDNFYDLYMTYKDVNKPGVAIYTLLESLQRKKGYLIDASTSLKVMEQQDLLEKKTYYDISLKSIQIPTNEDNLEIYNNYFNAYKKSKKVYDFSAFNEYTNEEYLDDLNFFKFLKKSTFFVTKPFITHPYYGLNSERKESDYDSIHSFLNDFIDDIKRFEKSIEDSQIKLSKWSDFNSIRDFDEAKKHFELYASYSGFPLNFFNIKETDELDNYLQELKECYRKESAMKLAINIATDEEIWKLDFDEILNKLRGKEEKQTIKQIRKLLKLNTKANYESLIVLLDKFQENKAKIREITPNLESDFGFLITDVDGINSIQDAFNFISSLNRHKILYDMVSFDNDFTNLIFNNQEYLDKYKNVYYPELIRLRSVVEHSLDEYKIIFNEDKFDYTQASFEEIIKRVKIRLDASKKEYIEYLDFSKFTDAASPELREALLQEEEREENLSNFKNDFYLSLYQLLLKRAMDNNSGVSLIEDECRNVFDIYKSLHDNGDLLRLRSNEEFDAIRKKYIINEPYNKLLKQLKEKYHQYKLYPSSCSLKDSKDIFYHVYPLETRSVDELNMFKDISFDLVIIDASEKIDTISLYSALRLGKRVVVYNSSILDDKLKYAPSIKFDLAKDLSSIGEHSELLLANIEDSLNKDGIQLIHNYKVEEGVVIPLYFEHENEKFALKFESKNFETKETESYIIPRDLYLNYDIKVVTLYIIPYIVYEDFATMSLYNDVRKKMQEDENVVSSLNMLSYDQQKKVRYFQMLDSIDSSFGKFKADDVPPVDYDHALLKSSSIEERPILNISHYDIANGIMTYLSNFTFLTKETLIKHLASVVGTNEKDIDFRLLFAKATSYLVDNNKITVDKSRYILNR